MNNELGATLGLFSGIIMLLVIFYIFYKAFKFATTFFPLSPEEFSKQWEEEHEKQ